MSARLHFVVEGQTEETYVNTVLRSHLADCSVWADARLVETGRRKGKACRGGVCRYSHLRSDLEHWMKQDAHGDVFFTTMIDLYGLASLQDRFPGWEEARTLKDPYAKVASLEEAWSRDIADRRFIPYLQLHEFEALILACPRHLLVQFVGREQEIGELEALAASFPSPELIDEGRDTAPSKRIIAKLPQYEGMKASAGPLVARDIGLDALRAKCRHFNEWLVRLEQVGAPKPS
jgi:hypothetical protein